VEANETAIDQYQLRHASYRERESLQRSELLGKLAQIDAALAVTRQTKAAFEEELRRDFKAEAKEIRKQVHEARTHLLQQELRLKMLVGELRKRAVTSADVAAVVDELAHSNDRLLVDHAASFRGARADIKKRLAVYLPYVQEAFAAVKSPALDLGCGRGEWMELLGEAGIPAKGIDLNRDLVSACREMGFDVMEGGVFQFCKRSRTKVLYRHGTPYPRAHSFPQGGGTD
jgi:predicted TPR repeat methyltransferase